MVTTTGRRDSRPAGIVGWAGRAALLVAISSCGGLADRNDPRHQGRTAASWIEELGRQSVIVAPTLFPQIGTGRSLDALRTIGPVAVPACIRLLAHEDQAVRIGAARALELYGPEATEAIPALVDALPDTPSAASALEKIGPPAVPALNALLAHEDPLVRLVTANALVRGDPARDDAFGVLVDGLAFVDAPFRNAVNGWGANYEKYEGAMEAVMADGRRFTNSEDGVRMMAARFLGGLGPVAAPAVSALVDVLGNPRYRSASLAAAEALGQIGVRDAAAVAALEGLLASPNAAIRSAAATALSKLRSP